MEIEKFRIKNYRSIVDSGDCYLSPEITVLAGKNEAGKTSILEALRDFTKSKDIEEDAVPINRDEAIPEIHVTFSVSPDEIEDSVPENISVPSEEFLVTVVKTYREGYKVKEDISDLISDFEKEKSRLVEHIKENLISRAFEFDSVDEEKFSFNDEGFSKYEVRKVRRAIPEAKEDNEIDEETVDTLVEDFKQSEDRLKEFNDFEDDFLDEIKDRIPDFVLFSTYEDQIPNKISFDELDESEFVEDLTQVSDLDSSILKQSGNDRKKREHKKEVNIELNEDYQEFWTQDETSLYIDWDSENLQFWIEEDGTPYEPKHRSKGKMWHLSFYVKLTAHASKENPPVVLIDCPGLHLHAKAQKDILKKLESVAETSRVIYSTHSPYLIDAEKLDRVWLVRRKKGKGTKIEKLHADADKDTLRPILTAIGANTSIGVHTDKQNSVVVEGISDYHYLQAFREIIDWGKDLDIIPGTGGDSPVSIGSILFGWGLEPIFCLDSDGQGEDNRNKLKTKLNIDEERIIQVPVDGDIEDVFTKSDFKKYVLQDEDEDYESSNSDYLKPNRGDKDKVLLAKKFHELARKKEPDLDEGTRENLQSIFDQFNQVME